MPPIWLSPQATHLLGHGVNFSEILKQHGGHLLQHYYCCQPYTTWTPQPDLHLLSLKFVLPTILQEKIKLLQDSALSRTTCTKVLGRLWEYISFCKGLGIHDDNILPASEDMLIAWASTYAGPLVGKTMGAKTLAIKREHQYRGLLWQGSKQLCLIIKGIKELRLVSSYHPKRAPVTIPMLTDISWALDQSSGLDNCICAICCLAFFGQLRIGELLPTTQDSWKFDRTCHATFANIAESTSKSRACNLHLPWSKTQKAHGDDIWIPWQEPPLDPIHTSHKHFVKNRLDISHPIAAYCNTNNQLITLTKNKFCKTC